MKKPPKCECHGEPCYWHKKKDMRAGGLWRCAVRKREVQRAAKRAYEPRENRQETDARYWHKPNGGYVRRRRKDLAGQRTQILDQLAQLEKEAASA